MCMSESLQRFGLHSVGNNSKLFEGYSVVISVKCKVLTNVMNVLSVMYQTYQTLDSVFFNVYET